MDMSKTLKVKNKDIIINKYANLSQADKNAQLFIAAKKDLSFDTKLLLEAGADIHAKDDINQTTAFIWAAQYGHINVMKVLYQKAAEMGNGAILSLINATNNRMETAISIAIFHNQVIAAHLLLDWGVDIHQKDNQNKSPLVKTFNKSPSELTHRLFSMMSTQEIQKEQREASDFYQFNREYNWFSQAIISNRKKLFSLFSSSIINNTVSALKRSELSQHFPVWYLDKIKAENEILQNILNEYKPLSLAAKNVILSELAKKSKLHNSDLIEIGLLVGIGADINTPDSSGNTPLMLALKSGNEEAAQIFVDMGANLHAKNTQGESVYSMAVKENNQNVAFQVLYTMTEEQFKEEVGSKAGMDQARLLFYLYDSTLKVSRNKLALLFKDTFDASQHFPIWYARNIENELQKAHNSVNQYKKLDQADKNALLIENIKKNSLTEVVFLLEAGADLHAKDDINQTTAFMWAVAKNHSKAMILLYQKAVELDQKGELGNTTVLSLINAQNNQNNTALLLSMSHVKSNATNLLLDWGVDIHAADNNGITPLIEAIIQNNVIAYRLMHMMSAEQQLDTEIQNVSDEHKLILTAVIHAFKNILSEYRGKLFSIFGEKFLLEESNDFIKNLEPKAIANQLLGLFPKWFHYRLENELQLCFTVLKEMKTKRLYAQLPSANNDQKAALIEKLADNYDYQNCTKYLGEAYANFFFPEKLFFELLPLKQKNALIQEKALFNELRFTSLYSKRRAEIIAELGDNYHYANCLTYLGQAYADKAFPGVSSPVISKKRKRSEVDNAEDIDVIETHSAKRICTEKEEQEGDEAPFYYCAYFSSIRNKICSYLPCFSTQPETEEDNDINMKDAATPKKRCN